MTMFSAVALLAAASSGEFVDLFNGKDLTGWRGDPAVWKVQQGTIVGTTDGHAIEHNTFLIHEKPVRDFHLKAQVRLRNNNSGIQFRSTVLDEAKWIVSGYQADFSEAGDRSAWGNFYEERGRSRTLMKTPDEGWQKGKLVYRKGDWNTVEVIAIGSQFRILLNGTETINTTDDKVREGVLAIQLHNGAPMRVEVRRIQIKTLKP